MFIKYSKHNLIHLIFLHEDELMGLQRENWNFFLKFNTLQTIIYFKHTILCLTLFHFKILSIVREFLGLFDIHRLNFSEKKTEMVIFYPFYTLPWPGWRELQGSKTNALKWKEFTLIQEQINVAPWDPPLRPDPSGQGEGRVGPGKWKG